MTTMINLTKSFDSVTCKWKMENYSVTKRREYILYNIDEPLKNYAK
jgi:hypothetical protein